MFYVANLVEKCWNFNKNPTFRCTSCFITNSLPKWRICRDKSVKCLDAMPPDECTRSKSTSSRGVSSKKWITWVRGLPLQLRDFFFWGRSEKKKWKKINKKSRVDEWKEKKSRNGSKVGGIENLLMFFFSSLVCRVALWRQCVTK